MVSSKWQISKPGYIPQFFKKIGGRYKRIRLRCKGSPMPEYYRDRVELLGELERLSQLGKIDLYYGDESHVCSEGYVPMVGNSRKNRFAF